MSRIPVPTAKLTAIESTDLEAEKAGIQYQYDQETSPVNLARIKRETNIGYQYHSPLETIGQGFPKRKELLLINLREFWNMQNELYVIDALIFKEGRVLIPKNIRHELIEQLHIGHQGVNSMKNNARQRFLGPDMGAQLQNKWDQCKRCNETAPSNPKESAFKPLHPDYPFQLTVPDIFHMAGRKYVIYADRYSG